MTDAANQKIRECGFETLHAGQEVDEQKSTGVTLDFTSGSRSGSSR